MIRIPSLEAPKKRRKSARQQVREERSRVLSEIRKKLIEHKRTLPKEWERAYMSAVSVVEIYAESSK